MFASGGGSSSVRELTPKPHASSKVMPETNGYVPLATEEPEKIYDQDAAERLQNGDDGEQPHSSRSIKDAQMWEDVFLLGEGSKSKSGRLAWIESTWFQSIVGSMIGLNALIIGLETDDQEKTQHWEVMEQIFLVFFTVEIFLRILRHGPAFFRAIDDLVWNWLDFCIVASGCVDQWVIPLLSWIYNFGSGTRQFGGIMMLMRLLRLFRIVRLFRLVRVIRPLYTLSQGILEAVQGMFWVLVTMALLFYAMGILCTRLLGHRLILPKDGDGAAVQAEVEKNADLFRTVPYSMYILFETMSSWTLVRFEPLFTEVPVLRLAFTLFYIYSTWTLLAVMTGVVSENMIAMREATQREDEEKEEARRMRATSVLIELFNRADVDGSGTVSREEFEDLLSSADDLARLRKHTKCRLSDLIDLFDTLDENGDGDITVEEFIAGFRAMNEPLSSKSLMKVERALKEDIHTMAAQAKSVLGDGKMPVPEPADLSSEVNAIAGKLDTVLRRLDAVAAGQQSHSVALQTLIGKATAAAAANEERRAAAAAAAEASDEAPTRGGWGSRLFRRGGGSPSHSKERNARSIA